MRHFGGPRIDMFCLPNDLTWRQSFRPFMSARPYYHPSVQSRHCIVRTSELPELSIFFIAVCPGML
jgi:hypothetical protein